MRDLTAYQGHGSLANPHGMLITWALMTEGGIQVNARGKRFANEHEGYSEHAVKVLAQPGGVAWVIFDDRLDRFAQDFPDYMTADEMGAIRRGSASEIAEQTGLPADSLAETLEQTRSFAVGAPDPLGRDFTGKPALGENLCAIRVTGALFHTQGGLTIDGNARVTDPNGTALPNLFAGGGAACGVSGSLAEGYLSGNGLLTAIGLGYVAGRAAARLTKGES
jgi:fumarate reductase flavoprotein subunit